MHMPKLTNPTVPHGPMISPRTTQTVGLPDWGTMQGPGTPLWNEMQAIDPTKLMSRSGDCRTHGDARAWLQRSDGLVWLHDKTMGTKTCLRESPSGHIEAILHHPLYDGYTACELTENNYRQILPQKGAKVYTQLGSCLRTTGHDDRDLSRELDDRSQVLPMPRHVQRQLASLRPQVQAQPEPLQNPFEASISTIPAQNPMDDSVFAIPNHNPMDDSVSTIFEPMRSPYTATRRAADATERRPGIPMRGLTFKVPAYRTELVKSPAQGAALQGVPPQGASQQMMALKLRSPRSPALPHSPLTNHMAPQKGMAPLQTGRAGPFLKAWVRPVFRRAAEPSPQATSRPLPPTGFSHSPAAGALPRIKPPY